MMENKKIELKEEEILFLKSLEGKLNVTEYSELRNIIEKYVQLARNNDWEVRRCEERLESARKREDKNYSKYIEEEKEKNKWKAFYTEVCTKYAKLEIELDLAKAKIEILEGDTNDNKERLKEQK